MLISTDWKDYELLDASDGERLERWGDIFLRRPDPQVIWRSHKDPTLWENVHARYHRNNSGGGAWQYRQKLDNKWIIQYKSLRFYVHPTGFKHTGLFPEQAVNWDWIAQQTAGRKGMRLLNLFAYSGAATAAAAGAGATVTHVDAAKGMVSWASENAELSGFKKSPIRWLVDDCFKFVEREKRRGSKYDAIIMDPPSYGRGPKGEVWKLEDNLFDFIMNCSELLSDKPSFMLINSYTTGLSPTVLQNMAQLTVIPRFGGQACAHELGLPITQSGLTLPCGAACRVEFN